MRYVVDRALPAVAYVPGKTARPPTAAAPAVFDPSSWARCSDYLWGFDLMNAGFPWEAHEAWEGLWRTLDRGTPAAWVLQALIKLAAAQVKLMQGQPRSVRLHSESAAALFRKVAEQAAPARVLMGIDLERAAALADALAHAPGGTATRIDLVGLR